MNIRKRLTFLFIGLVVLLLTVSSLAVFFFSADHRKEDFYNRLTNKAINAAKLLIEVDEIDADLLAKIEQDNPTSLPNEKITIYNYQNQVLYTSDSTSSIPVDRELLDKIRLEQEYKFEYKDYEVLGILYADRYDRFVVVAAAKDTFGKRKIRNLRNILIVTMVISVVLVSFSGWIYSGRALKPISKVINQVEKISETSLNLRLDEGDQTDEIGRLAMTFNNMLARLETAFVAQKNFIANASHELRTPLTAITGKIEVNLLQGRTKEEYENVLQSLLRDVRNLNLLSNRLLMLAQTSAEGVAMTLYPVRMDELLWQAQEEVLKLSKKYTVKIDLALDLDDDLLTVPGDDQLLKAAIINLMDNGCKYSSDHQVVVSVSFVQDQLVISFQDNGMGIPSEEQNNIFEPFYRAQNAMQIAGHGIGLSLVRKIVLLHNGKVTFTSELGVGTRFVITLPKN